MLNKRDEQRCRILIPQSRLLFGVCDPSSKSGSMGRLKRGECFVRVPRDGNGMPETIINTEVLVTRNPYLHPGDLQKFKAVDVPEFADSLVDCIVFSTRGTRHGSSAAAATPTVSTPSIAILTPYNSQKEALSRAIPSIEVFSMDGFQGREADVVVFVTVRCNAECKMGFSTDMRRLNVVMTRAKLGVIVIGNQHSLTSMEIGAEGLDESRLVWKRLFDRCKIVELAEENKDT